MTIQAPILTVDPNGTKETVREIFDKWAPEYDRDSQQVTLEFARSRLYEVIQLREGTAVLDVSCGTGNTLLKLSELSLYREFAQVRLEGIDLSAKMIKVARLKAGLLPNVSFEVGDAEAIPAEENSFDYVLSSAAFHWYPNPLRSLREGLRVLRPGGQMIIVDKAFVGAIALSRRIQMALGLYKPRPELLKLYFPSQIEALFKEAGFVNIETRYHKAPFLVPVTLPVVTMIGTKPAPAA